MQFGTIENKELTAIIKANGILKVPNNDKANVTSLFGGVITALKIQEGEEVKKGQIIAVLSNPEIIELQENYLTTKNKLALATLEQQRQKTLNEGNAGVLKNLQQAENELKLFRIQQTALREKIRLMGINPDALNSSNIRSNIVVKAPIDGVISQLFAKIGSYIDVSSPVAEIVDNNSLHLDLQVFEKDLPLLHQEQRIHFTLTNNPVNEYDAEIYSVGASFVNNSKTVSVHANVLGNKKGLIDGMNITGLVSLSKTTTPAVKTDAIVESNGRNYIFVLAHYDKKKKIYTFDKIEVIKGTTEVGFTAISPTQEIATRAKILTEGAFFANAKLVNSGEHEH